MSEIKLDVLAIAVHPDDAELGCSGTLMVQKSKGQKIGVVDLTRGELGTRGTAQTRREESEAASRVIGLDARENLGMADGFFENTKENKLKIIRAIRKYQPDIVLANAPEDRHPDHGRAGKLIYDSCFLSGLVKIETELNGKHQQAWRPRQVFHYIQDRYLDPDFIIDISEVIEKKKEAIRCFKTQFNVNTEEEVQTYISTPQFFRSILQRTEMWGKMIGTAHGEGFISSKKLGITDLRDFITHP